MKSPCLLLRASVSVFLFLSASVYSAGLDSSSSSPSDTPTSAKAPEVPQPGPVAGASVAIPGPLRSFLRMAGISQKISPEEVLPLLARNVAVEGYQGRKDRTGRPTEFLILLKRYVGQARELVTLAGPEGVIRVANCEQAGPLLGYSRLPAAAGLRKGRCAGNGRSGTRLSDHRFRISSCRT